jgi:hypothetical protein
MIRHKRQREPRPSSTAGSDIRNRAMAAAAVTASLISASCSNSDHSPGKSASLQSSPALSAPSSNSSPAAVPAAPSPAGTSAGDQIVAAYNGYWAATKRAGLVPIDQVPTILAPYATPALISAVTNALKDIHAKLEEPWGDITVHVYSIKAAGTRASLRDCQDASRAGMADARTHQLIPNTRGKPTVDYSVTLQRDSDGKWRVGGLRNLGTSCSTSGSKA